MAIDHRLRVGIDFGTTFSGVSWVDTAKPEEVVIITDWPGAPRKHEKVPSEISYTSTGEVDKWGYGIKSDQERLAWFKLLLQPTTYRTNSTLIRTKRLIPNPDIKGPVDVISDYLACLRKHTLDIIKRRYGIAFLNATPIDYMLTVPAIWTDNAKTLMLKAAESAGFGSKINLQLMSEPDAAAAWTLLRDLKISTLKVKDAFVVVDCGGGTVDLISYEVVQVTPHLIVKECAPGTGGMCGSTFLNGNFEELVRARIGRRFEAMKIGPRNRMMKAFEEDLKPSFTNSEDDDVFTCPIGGVKDDPVAGIQYGGFILTRDDMRGIFDPVIDEIVPLVQGQIDIVEKQAHRGLRLSSILLVGGFGSSRYLLQRLEGELKEKTKGREQPPLEILQPVNAWSAVARGAALGIRIASRTARLHYGTDCDTKFIFGIHPLRNRFYSYYTGEILCRNYMQWYIERGDLVSEEEPISMPFTFYLGLDDDGVVTSDLYKCEQDLAPEYLDDVGNPVKKLCTLVADLSMVPRTLFTKKIGIGSEPYYEVNFDLVMTVKSAMVIIFHLEFCGKKYGSVMADYTS